jgi:hypothetical protein
MRIDRDAAPVVDDRHVPVGGELDFDEGRIAGQRLIHGIVDHFGEQMVQRFFVGAADIHAGAAAHRFEAFEDLDITRRVAALASARARALARRGAARLRKR